jgi:sulfur carrier protein
MRVRVNGVVEEHPSTCTLAELLAARGTDPRYVAVARNEACVPRTELAATRLEPGDAIEILAPMQGG